MRRIAAIRQTLEAEARRGCGRYHDLHCYRSEATNASGCSRLRKKVSSVIVKISILALTPGEIVSRTPPVGEPLTVQVRPQPCTPRCTLPCRDGSDAG